MKKITLCICCFLLAAFVVACVPTNQSETKLQSHQTLSSIGTTTSMKNEHDDPYEVFILNSEEELAYLRQLAVGDDGQLNEYLSSKSTGGLHNKAEVQSFLKLIDSMIIPVISDKKAFSVYFCPGKPYLHFVYKISDTEWYRFEYIIDEETEKKLPQYFQEKCEVMDSEISSDRTAQVKLIANTILAKKNKTYYTHAWLKMGGYYVSVHYKNENTNPENVDLEQLFKKYTYKQALSIS